MAHTTKLLAGVVALGALLGLSLWTAVVVPRPPVTDAAASHEAPAISYPSKSTVVETILSYAENTRADDPMVEVESGVWAKSSNYRGVTIGGRVYYYAILPHQSFDPLTLGTVTPSAVEVIEEIHDADYTIVVYTLRRPGLKGTAS